MITPKAGCSVKFASLNFSSRIKFFNARDNLRNSQLRNVGHRADDPHEISRIEIYYLSRSIRRLTKVRNLANFHFNGSVHSTNIVIIT